jgi:hypothetical protein
MDAAELLLGRDELDGLGVRLRAGTLPPAGGLVPVPVVVEVPIADLVADRGRRRMELDVQVYAVDGTDTVQDLWVRTLHLDLAALRKTERQGEPREGVRLLAGLAVPPGEYRLRTLVSDVKGERASLVTTPLTVPADGGGLLPHDPVVVDRSPGWLRLVGLPDGPGGAAGEALSFGDAALVPPVAPRMAVGEALEFLVVTPAGAGVELSGRVLDLAGGAVVPLEGVTLAAREADAEATLVRYFGRASTERLPAGSYRLEVSARDAAGGRVATRSVLFAIGPEP